MKPKSPSPCKASRRKLTINGYHRIVINAMFKKIIKQAGELESYEYLNSQKCYTSTYHTLHSTLLLDSENSSGCNLQNSLSLSMTICFVLFLNIYVRPSSNICFCVLSLSLPGLHFRCQILKQPEILSQHLLKQLFFFLLLLALLRGDTGDAGR